MGGDGWGWKRMKWNERCGNGRGWEGLGGE